MEGIYAKKEEFVKELGELLSKHEVNDILGMEYSKKEDGFEIVKVIYHGDGCHLVNVSGDSNTGILIDIIRQTGM